MVDVHSRFRLNRIETCPCAIIYKLRVEYYPVTLMECVMTFTGISRGIYIFSLRSISINMVYNGWGWEGVVQWSGHLWLKQEAMCSIPGSWLTKLRY